MVEVIYKGQIFEHRATFRSILNGTDDYWLRSLDKKTMICVPASRCRKVMEASQRGKT
jgi:hypothetical protein